MDPIKGGWQTKEEASHLHGLPLMLYGSNIDKWAQIDHLTNTTEPVIVILNRHITKG